MGEDWETIITLCWTTIIREAHIWYMGGSILKNPNLCSRIVYSHLQELEPFEF